MIEDKYFQISHKDQKNIFRLDSEIEKIEVCVHVAIQQKSYSKNLTVNGKVVGSEAIPSRVDTVVFQAFIDPNNDGIITLKTIPEDV